MLSFVEYISNFYTKALGEIIRYYRYFDLATLMFIFKRKIYWISTVGNELSNAKDLNNNDLIHKYG